MQVKEGFEIEKTNELFSDLIQEIVDYRGDITLFLEDGNKIEGYIYDFSDDAFHLFPEKGDKVSIQTSQITKLLVTGKDTAEGKSWEAWAAKKKKEKEAAAASN